MHNSKPNAKKLSFSLYFLKITPQLTFQEQCLGYGKLQNWSECAPRDEDPVRTSLPWNDSKETELLWACHLCEARTLGKAHGGKVELVCVGSTPQVNPHWKSSQGSYKPHSKMLHLQLLPFIWAWYKEPQGHCVDQHETLQTRSHVATWVRSKCFLPRLVLTQLGISWIMTDSRQNHLGKQAFAYIYPCVNLPWLKGKKPQCLLFIWNSAFHNNPNFMR